MAEDASCINPQLKFSACAGTGLAVVLAGHLDIPLGSVKTAEVKLRAGRDFLDSPPTRTITDVVRDA